ncbi:uncharacterized protein LOC118812511 isoform X1 [Colossoma macropomum]|uniref:uncharacterized protein LOC118812511 isoform X1 n=1 Tax=Colossoma macropomum TaxID=42526 RepID=UPI0018653A8E|nr:uncharacterized protein LOC118812511 isoform X1 [Colossoma macropomum]
MAPKKITKVKKVKAKPSTKKPAKPKAVKSRPPAKKTTKAKTGLGGETSTMGTKAKGTKAKQGVKEETSAKKLTKDQGKVVSDKKRTANPVASEPPKKRRKTQSVGEKYQTAPTPGKMANSNIPHAIVQPVTVMPIVVPAHDARNVPDYSNSTNPMNAAPHSSHGLTSNSAASAPTRNSTTKRADDLDQDENYQFLRNNRSALIDRVKNVIRIVDDLESSGEEVALVRAEPTDQARMRKVLEFTNSKKAAELLVKALWEHAPDIMEDLTSAA